MSRVRRLLLCAAPALLAWSCATHAPSPAKTAATTARAREEAHAQARAGSGGALLLATVDGTAVVALPGTGFSELPREQRLFAYWLAQAARAGDAIAWDQSYRHNVQLVRLLRGILTRPQAVPDEVLVKVQRFARRVYLNRGLHDAATERKLTPPFTAAELRLAALAAQAAGADLGLGAAHVEPALRALEGALFDPQLDAVRTSRRPGEDPLRASAVNLYSGVSLQDLRGFREQHAGNSRLVMEGGHLVEQVYRAGAPASGLAPGLYAERLQRAAAALDQAGKLVEGAQRQAVQHLAAFLRTGSADELRAEHEAAQPLQPQVDALLGFLGPYADPRGVKGLWLGVVGFRDEVRSQPLLRLAQEVAWFEQHGPFPEESRREPRAPTAEALVLAAASGAARPEPFVGLQLAPAQRGRPPGKAVLFPGLDDAAAEARDVRATEELAPPALAADLVRCRGRLRFAAAALHEVVGHAGSSPANPVAGEHAATLEEARAELVAHWHLPDPKLVELGLIADPSCQKLWPQLAAIGWQTSLGLVPEGERLDGVELRAQQLQLWWFLQRKVVVPTRIDGKQYLTVPDPAAFRKAAGGLLSLLQTIEAAGDAALLRGLIEGHASRLDPALRDEVVRRLTAAGIPRRVAALPPVLRAIGEGGEVKDVALAPITDLDAQILEDWAGF